MWPPQNSQQRVNDPWVSKRKTKKRSGQKWQKGLQQANHTSKVEMDIFKCNGLWSPTAWTKLGPKSRHNLLDLVLEVALFRQCGSKVDVCSRRAYHVWNSQELHIGNWKFHHCRVVGCAWRSLTKRLRRNYSWSRDKIWTNCAEIFCESQCSGRFGFPQKATFWLFYSNIPSNTSSKHWTCFNNDSCGCASKQRELETRKRHMLLTKRSK